MRSLPGPARRPSLDQIHQHEAYQVPAAIGRRTLRMQEWGEEEERVRCHYNEVYRLRRSVLNYESKCEL